MDDFTAILEEGLDAMPDIEIKGHMVYITYPFDLADMREAVPKIPGVKYDGCQMIIRKDHPILHKVVDNVQRKVRRS